MTIPLHPPADRRRRRTHAAVLDAAADLFLHQGFRRTGVDELAATADVALSSIYANFPGGKADVYLALACRVVEQHGEEMAAVIAAPPVSPMELAVFDEYRRFHRDNPLAFRLIGLTDVDAADSELFGPARKQIRGVLAGLVDAVVDASSTTHELARSETLRLWAAINGLLTLQAHGFVDQRELDGLLDAERTALADRVRR